MFDKLKQIKQLREMQNIIKKERVEIEKNGIKVIVNGKFEIEEICLNKELNYEEQEKVLKDCLNQAIKEIQLLIARKFSGMF